MISLLGILRETRYAPLYHTTYGHNLVSIVNDGYIEPNEQGYVFLTRDKRYRVGGSATAVVFKIDQEKVRQRYKVIPRVGDIANKDKRVEAEEMIKGKIPLDWVEEIQVPQSKINNIKDAIETFKKGIEWAKNKNMGPEKIAGYERDIEEYTRVLEHPKLTIVPGSK